MNRHRRITTAEIQEKFLEVLDAIPFEDFHECIHVTHDNFEGNGGNWELFFMLEFPQTSERFYIIQGKSKFENISNPFIYNTNKIQNDYKAQTVIKY